MYAYPDDIVIEVLDAKEFKNTSISFKYEALV